VLAEEPGDGVVAGEARQLRSRRLQAVADLRAVRHASPAADVEDGLASRRFVAERAVVLLDVASAAALGEQHHQVDEGEAEPAHDHRLSRPDGVEVEVSGVGGWHVNQAVLLGEARVRLEVGRHVDVEVAEREHDDVDGNGPLVFQVHHLLAIRSAGHVERDGGVLDDGDPGRRLAADPLEHPSQVCALELTGGEAHAVELADLAHHGLARQLVVAHQRGPLVERRARHDRSLALDAVVGEHRDVLGHRVHPEERRLLVAPHATAARWVGVDEVDLERTVAHQLARVGDEPLEERRSRRTGADHGHARGRAHDDPSRSGVPSGVRTTTTSTCRRTRKPRRS
jgi:hypothetical protein